MKMFASRTELLRQIAVLEVKLADATQLADRNWRTAEGYREAGLRRAALVTQFANERNTANERVLTAETLLLQLHRAAGLGEPIRENGRVNLHEVTAALGNALTSREEHSHIRQLELRLAAAQRSNVRYADQLAAAEGREVHHPEAVTQMLAVIAGGA